MALIDDCAETGLAVAVVQGGVSISIINPIRAIFPEYAVKDGQVVSAVVDRAASSV